MKPCSHQALRSGNLLQELSTDSSGVIVQLNGSVRKLGVKYQDALVVIYNKANLQPLAIRKPDQDGNYQVLGLNNTLTLFVIAFDSLKQYNAVIQDNVVPK